MSLQSLKTEILTAMNHTDWTTARTLIDELVNRCAVAEANKECCNANKSNGGELSETDACACGVGCCSPST